MSSTNTENNTTTQVNPEDIMQDTQRLDDDVDQQQQQDVTTTTTTSSSSADSSPQPVVQRKSLTPPPSIVGYTEPSTIDEKRQAYLCGANNYITLTDLPLYSQYAQQSTLEQPNIQTIKDVFKRYRVHQDYSIFQDYLNNSSNTSDANSDSTSANQLINQIISNGYYEYNQQINDKISFYRGDVTCLEIDAVVNAANESLLGGGGIDGAIHRAAGSLLRKYNAHLNGCDTGCTKISPGFKLPAKFILNTVGPVGENPQKLTSAYSTCLELVSEYSLKTVAFCGISTGIFGYPLDKATMIAMHTIRQWLELNVDKVDRIIFITFLKKEVDMYNTIAPYFFPFKPLQ